MANKNVADVRKRVRGQIVDIRCSVGRIIEVYRRGGKAERCIALDDVAAIPIGLRPYKDLLITSNIKFDRLPIQRQKSVLRSPVLEFDLLKAAELAARKRI